jgi:hypothetical protein
MPRLFTTLVLVVCSALCAEAAPVSAELAASIERFSSWKSTVESTVFEAKRGKIVPAHDMQALRLLYIPVLADVNAVIDRIIADIELGRAMSIEPYRHSLTKAQGSVDRFQAHVQKALQVPPEAKPAETTPDEPMPLVGHLLQSVADVVHFLSSVVERVTACAGANNGFEEDEKRSVIDKLKLLKLRAFDQIL